MFDQMLEDLLTGAPLRKFLCYFQDQTMCPQKRKSKSVSWSAVCDSL